MKKIYSIFVCLCLLAGFVACEKDKDFALNTLAVNDEKVSPSFETAEVSCSFKADATISDAFVQYSLSSSFAKYEVAKMTEDKGKYTAHLTGLVDNTTYYIRYSVSNKYSSVVAEKVVEFKTLPCTVPTIVLDSIAGVKENQAKVHLRLTSNGGAVVTDMGICWSKQANPTTKDIHKSTDDTLAVLDITDLQPNTQYYVRAYAMNKIGIAYSEEVVFTTLWQVVLPTVTTTSATSVTETSAVTGGNVTSDGNASVTERGVVYATTQNPTTANTKVASGNGTGSFVCNLSGLQPNTKYYVRAYAINSKGTAYGEEVSFTTNKQIVLPTVKTTAASSVTETSAVTGGNVTSDGNASVTERGVVYATTQNPTTANTKVASGNGTGSFVCNLNGLQPNTKYYVRAYAINSKGTAYGEEISFTTLKQVVLPTVTTTSATSVTETSAVTGGNVTSDGNAAVTERGVVYATTQNPTTANTKVASGNGTGSFVCNLSGLQPNTKYYVRAYAINSKGTAYGEEVSFTTNKQIVLPTVKTTAASSVTETSAVTGGNVTSDGNATVTERGVVYSTTQNPTTANTKVASGSGTGSFVCNLSGLQPNTKYYVRAYAINSKGIAYGEEITFITNKSISLPIVTTAAVTSVTESSAVTGGNVTSDGNASVTERGVVYSTNPDPVITNLSNTIRPCGSGTGEFTYTITGLQANTKYYVRAYAKNDAGTAYGEEISFVTNENTSHNGYEYVDLGLSVKWATMNVGAEIPEDYGDYFAWGETAPKEVYDRSTYKWCNGSKNTLTKYNTISSYGTVDNKTQLELSDDAASVNWGGSWRIPTNTEMTELREQCTWTWITQNGVNGYKVTSKSNGNSIFLPAAGYYYDNSSNRARSYGYYWSSLLSMENPDNAWFVYYDTGNKYGEDGNRYYGRSIRAVIGEYKVEETPPTVTTTTATSVTETSAVTGGNVTSDGNATVTERGVVYATTQNPTTANTKVASGSGTGSFTCNLSGLQPNTTYYVRAYAINSKGTAYGTQVTFTTSISIPTVTTTIVSSIRFNYAMTGGNVTSDGGATVTERGVVYSTTKNPTTTSATKVASGSGTGVFTTPLGDLSPNTTYYVRAYATNSAGTAYGTELTFTTEKQVVLPTVTTNNVTSVTTTSAITGGNVTNDGNGDIIERGIVYSSTSQYPTTASATKVTSGTGTGIFSIALEDLTPSTKYYVRAYAKNSAGTAYGGQAIFTTSDLPTSVTLPTVTTTAASSIKETSAVTGGNVTSDGNATVTERGIVYNTYANPTVTTATKVLIGSGKGAFTYTLTGLQSNTKYYVRAYATNEKGTAYGSEISFTTLEKVIATPEYVDLGLSVKWATFNVGASKPEDYGDYFAWGETQPKSTYDWGAYKWCNGNNYTQTKYCTQSNYGTIDNKTTLEMSDDAARANWGGNWRMPTMEEHDELRENCTWTWTTQNGVNGYRVTSKSNGNSIFLPAAGCRYDSSLSSVGKSARYWSSSLYTDLPYNAYALSLFSNSVSSSTQLRYWGLSVRPVCP